MGHQIEQFEDGTSAFFSARELPWHKLGTVTAGALTAQEAITTAQQDWLVEKRPIYTKLEDGTYLEVKDKFATVRNHPKAGFSALGVVGNQYVPVQNMEAFEILDAIRDDSGAVYETAGSLYNGKRVFISMKLPDTLKFAGGQDNVDLYILASNSHDSSTAFQLMVTPIRVVCANTLAMAVGEEIETIESLAEPFLVRMGFLARTPRGRVATAAGWMHLGIKPPLAISNIDDPNLFDIDPDEIYG